MKKFINICLPSLPFSVAIVCIFGITYLAIQQYIRLSANEIPLQYALDAKVSLEKGMAPQLVAGNLLQTDLQTSTDSFIMICDNSGRTLATSAILNNHMPHIPAGVFAAAQLRGENRRTWQPEYGVRNAIVVLPCTINGQQYFVVGGRSLKETEVRESFLLSQMTVGTLLTLFATFIATIIVQLIRTRLNRATYNVIQASR